MEGGLINPPALIRSGAAEGVTSGGGGRCASAHGGGSSGDRIDRLTEGFQVTADGEAGEAGVGEGVGDGLRRDRLRQPAPGRQARGR